MYQKIPFFSVSVIILCVFSQQFLVVCLISSLEIYVSYWRRGRLNYNIQGEVCLNHVPLEFPSNCHTAQFLVSQCCCFLFSFNLKGQDYDFSCVPKGYLRQYVCTYLFLISQCYSARPFLELLLSSKTPASASEYLDCKHAKEKGYMDICLVKVTQKSFCQQIVHLYILHLSS